jgi:transposase
VPETLSEAKELVENSDMEKMRSTALKGYRLVSTGVEYGGVKQRWIVVFSEKAFTREERTLEKKMEKAWKYHKLKGIEVVERRKRKGSGRGRPENGEDLERFYQIKAGFEEDEGAIRKALLRRGKFIVATNELDSEIENEDRIVAMVMVMGLALMVYSLAEHKLREALEKENETIPDQRKKPTRRKRSDLIKLS